MPEDLQPLDARWREDGPRAEHAALVLGAARAGLEQGWSQGRWHVVQDGAGRHRDVPAASFAASFTGLDRTRVVRSCLVGAVLQAAWWYSDRPEHAAPALDALWIGLQGSLGRSADPIARVCSPDVRLSRVRELTRWNDRPGRTRQEVLDLLDRSLAGLAPAGV
jgi:hypothetical protein